MSRKKRSTYSREALPEREKEFHDRFYGGAGFSSGMDPFLMFESPAGPENKFILDLFGDLKGKTVIDAGAGTGEASLYFALKGARVIWCDVSSSAAALAKEAAARYGVADTIEFRVGDAADILRTSGAESADLIYGNGFLHHVDYARFPALFHRVLKKGGRFAFIEPLKYNPVIHLYRLMAGAMRTPDEKPLGFEAAGAFGGSFEVGHAEFWLTGLLVFLKFYLIDRVHPSQEPYWKKIFYDLPKNRSLLERCAKLDSCLVRLPPLNYLCWNTVLYGKKK